MGNSQANRNTRIHLPQFYNQKQKLLALSSNYVAEKLQMSTWDLSNGKINNKQLKQIFKHISQTAVRDLNLEANNEKYIMKNFMSVKFTNLIVLNLNGNAIQSIQDLQCFDCSKLQVLKLQWNYISRIKTLEKCSFKRLTKLFLNQNFISTSGRVLQTSNFSKLNQLRLEQNWREDQYQKNVSPKIEDILQKIVKFKSHLQQHLYLLKIQRKNRINSSKLIKMQKQLFKNISIVRYFQQKHSKSQNKYKIKPVKNYINEYLADKPSENSKKQEVILDIDEQSDEDAQVLDQSKN